MPRESQSRGRTWCSATNRPSVTRHRRSRRSPLVTTSRGFDEAMPSSGRGDTTAASAGATAQTPNGGDEMAVRGPHRPGRDVAMTLLVPHAGSPVRLDQLQAELDQRRRVVVLCWFGSVELNAAEVFRADEPVLFRAHQSRRRAVVPVERPTIEVFGDEHVV